MMLYHYTTINVLALILKNKTLRFNCLSHVDDLEEGISSDLGSFRKYIFASSWTSEAEENIALWNMYTKNMHGVRLGLDQDAINFNYKKNNLIKSTVVDNIIPQNIDTVFTKFDTQPCQVEYDLDVENNQLVVESNDFGKEYRFRQVFKKKRSIWNFQKEYRYVLFGCSKSEVEKKVNPQYLSSVHIMSSILDNVECECEYVDLILPDNAFKSIKILLGPKRDDSERIIVESLVNTYLGESYLNRINESNLKISSKI